MLNRKQPWWMEHFQCFYYIVAYVDNDSVYCIHYFPPQLSFQCLLQWLQDVETASCVPQDVPFSAENVQARYPSIIWGNVDCQVCNLPETSGSLHPFNTRHERSLSMNSTWLKLLYLLYELQTWLVGLRIKRTLKRHPFALMFHQCFKITSIACNADTLVCIAQKRPIEYSIKVHTSDDKGAGTDSEVYIIMEGTPEKSTKTQSSGEIVLKAPIAGNKKNLFEAGQVDKFVVKACDLWPLTKLSVGHNGRGFGCDWKVKIIVVQALPPHPDRPAQVFYFDAWLRKPPNIISVTPLVRRFISAATLDQCCSVLPVLRRFISIAGLHIGKRIGAPIQYQEKLFKAMYPSFRPRNCLQYSTIEKRCVWSVCGSRILSGISKPPRM